MNRTDKSVRPHTQRVKSKSGGQECPPHTLKINSGGQECPPYTLFISLLKA
jgi:hypothetical protein